MAKANQMQASPTKGVWWRFLVLVPLTIALVLICRSYIQSVGSAYEAFGKIPSDGRIAAIEDVVIDRDGIVEIADIGIMDAGNVRVVFHAVADGKAEVTVRTSDTVDHWSLRVENGTIVEGGVNFSGWESIHVSLCVFLAVLTVLFASVFVRLVRRSWYGYVMVSCGGGFLFSLCQFMLFLAFLALGSLRNFSDLAFEITTMADYFVYLSFIPMGLLALLVSLSNISLIRHEGLRPMNLLGIAASVVWAAANFFLFGASGLVYQMLNSVEVAQLVDSLIAVGISFGECLLLSTIFFAWLASRHVPGHGTDYAIILGCGLRPDGTPCALLAGRVDRALAFDRDRTAAGDAPAVFVPSGGQGPDEIVSEAESMRDYLMSKGVEAERIVLEDRSTSTRQNMAFSREVIEDHSGCDASESQVVFSTTNYHVFRGYVCAHQAGMAVEGVGSKTRAYFWPNAFLREFAGLLVAQWKSILQVYVILAIIYGVAEYTLTLV